MRFNSLMKCQVIILATDMYWKRVPEFGYQCMEEAPASTHPPHPGNHRQMLTGHILQSTCRRSMQGCSCDLYSTWYILSSYISRRANTVLKTPEAYFGRTDSHREGFVEVKGICCIVRFWGCRSVTCRLTNQHTKMR